MKLACDLRHWVPEMIFSLLLGTAQVPGINNSKGFVCLVNCYIPDRIELLSQQVFQEFPRGYHQHHQF